MPPKTFVDEIRPEFIARNGPFRREDEISGVLPFSSVVAQARRISAEIRRELCNALCLDWVCRAGHPLES